MRWTPRLSRYVVCDRSTTRPGAVLGTTAMSWARQSATLARSISPSGAAIGTPPRSMTLTIAVTVIPSPAFAYVVRPPPPPPPQRMPQHRQRRRDGRQADVEPRGVRDLRAQREEGDVIPAWTAAGDLAQHTVHQLIEILSGG